VTDASTEKPLCRNESSSSMRSSLKRSLLFSKRMILAPDFPPSVFWAKIRRSKPRTQILLPGRNTLKLTIRNIYSLALITFLFVSCGDDTPTSPTPSASSAPVVGNGALSGPIGALALQPLVTIGEIIDDFETLHRTDVTIQGRVTEQLPNGDYLITDGTGSIPGDFSETPPPPLNTQIRIIGRVLNGGANFPAKLDVDYWDDLKKFNCDILTDARLRFTDPGFSLGSIVGAFLKYSGVPPGDKVLEMIWDDGNPKGDVDTFDLGQGQPQGDGTFLLEGVITHEYKNVTKTEKKKVRANLTIEGVDGRCSRVRDVTVSPGDGPDSAANGSLRVTVDNPVASGKAFEVRGTVKNLVTAPISVDLLFRTPTDSKIDTKTLPPGCEALSGDIVECVIGSIPPDDGLSKVVTYIAPTVSQDRDLKGSVTLVAGEFAPVVNYVTTVENPRPSPAD